MEINYRKFSGLEVAHEGAANILYRIGDGRLLRVSKRGKTATSIVNEWSIWHDTPIGSFIPSLVATDNGVVLDELTPLAANFKPKWLLPSPDAPKSAVQCRTCAIKMLRRQEQLWCPLDLGDPVSLPLVLELMGCASAARDVIVKSRIISKIKCLQEQLECSVFQEPLSPRLLHCMCIRDCSILVEESGRIALVDLDMKEEAKIRKWRDIERRLQPVYLIENPVCRLSRRKNQGSK